jgi:hypothetical protein
MENVLISKMREATVEQKAQTTGLLSALLRQRIMSGVRLRHPKASSDELRWHFIVLAYGEATAQALCKRLVDGDCAT